MKSLAVLGLAFLSSLDAQLPIAEQFVTVNGTISVEGAQLPPGYLRVVLDPVGSGNELSAEVRRDGSFTIRSVPPGHWRVSASGTFVKSVTYGTRKYSKSDVVIGDQMELPLKIVASTNFASLKVTASGGPQSTPGILFFFWIDGVYGPMFPVVPDHSDRMIVGGMIALPPGRHLVCAFVGVQNWMDPQSSSDFSVLRPALQRHCKTIKLLEGEQAVASAVQAPFISAEELERLRRTQ